MPTAKKRRRTTGKSGNLKIPRDAKTGQFVIRALNDPQWDYRTAEAIARETKKPLEDVKTVLASDDRVRKSVMKSRSGRDLYTLKVRKSKIGDYFSAFQSMNSDKLKG